MTTPENFLCALCLLAWGIPIVYFDIRENRIPNALTYSGIFLGLAVLVLFRRHALPDYGLAFLAGFGVFYVLFMFGWVGGGDAKLMGMIGLLMGMQFLANAMVYIALAGGLLAIGVMIALRAKGQPIRGARVPYGTAIIAGSYYAIFQSLLSGGGI